MKLAYPKQMDKTPIFMQFTQGLDENGKPNEVATYSGYCYFNEKSTVSTDAGSRQNGRTLELSSIATIGCDPAPSLPTLEGYVIVYGVTYNILHARRPRNPDGSVHHTVLELI